MFPKSSFKTDCYVSKQKNYSIKNIINNLIKKVETYLNPYIKISEEQKEGIDKMLFATNKNTTCDTYVSNLIATAVLLWVAVQILIMPIIVFFNLSIALALVLPIFIAVFYVILNLRKLKSNYISYKNQIENDLPKFCSVIASRLQSTSVTSEILKSFLPICSKQMHSELTKTLKDISMSSTEAALLRFEGRISSNKLSEVIRGLIAVSRGDNQQIYFMTKQAEFNSDYKVFKRRDIKKRAFKLSPAFLVLTLVFLLTILYPMTILFKNNNLF